MGRGPSGRWEELRSHSQKMRQAKRTKPRTDRGVRSNFSSMYVESLGTLGVYEGSIWNLLTFVPLYLARGASV
jgi:hypothetical protein